MQRHHFTNKVHKLKAMVFPVAMYGELDYKESWVPENGCFQIVVLEKTLESPLDCKEIKPVHPKRNQPWIFIGRTEAEAEAPILWPPDEKNQLTGKKTLMLRKTEGKRRRGWQRMRWLNGITDSKDMSLNNSGRQWRTGKPGVLQFTGSKRVGHDLATEQQKQPTHKAFIWRAVLESFHIIELIWSLQQPRGEGREEGSHICKRWESAAGGTYLAWQRASSAGNRSKSRRQASGDGPGSLHCMWVYHWSWEL